jgi:hypothetical protein
LLVFLLVVGNNARVLTPTEAGGVGTLQSCFWRRETGHDLEDT